MNQGQIQTQASLFAEDPAQTRFQAYYSDAINRAQEQFAMDSKALFKDASTYTTVDGTATYSLPTDFWLEKEVTHKGLGLKPITKSRLLQFAGGDDWTDDSGTPKFFLINPEEGSKTLQLYPIPGADDAGANLILTYYPFPAALSASTDTPLNASLLMTQFHMAIAAYAAWLLLGYETATPEKQAKRADLMRMYGKGVAQAIETFANTASAPWRLTGGKYWRRDF